MKKNNFLKNVLVLLFSQGIVKIVGIVYKLYLTNKLGYGDTGNALFAAAFQVYAIFLTVCSIGVPNAISSLVSEKFATGDNRGAYRILKVALVIFGTLGFISCCVLFSIAGIISNVYLQMPETETILRTLSPSIFIVGIASVLKGYFNGKQKMQITANSLSIEQIVRTICTIILVEVLSFISKNNTVLMVCAVGISATIGDVVSLLYIYWNYLSSRREIWTDIITSKTYKKERKRDIIKNILRVSFPIAICALIGTLNKTIDAMTAVRIAKRYLGEPEAVRQYGILSGKVESLILFPLSFNMAFTTTLIPTISGLKAKGENEKVKHIAKFTILIGILIGIPCFIVMFVFSEDILKILFPNASDGSVMLKYNSIIIIIAIITQTINSYLQGMHKMRIQIISISIGCIVKLILNILLIKNEQIGIYGAVISNIISYIFILVLLVCYLIEKEKIHFELDKFLIKPVILMFTMYIILKNAYKLSFINSNIFELCFSILIAGIVYISMIILFKIITKKDLKNTTSSRHKTRKMLKINKK